MYGHLVLLFATKNMENNNTLFASQRLLFKRFVPGDGGLIYDLNSDPDVLKYLHEVPTTAAMAEQVVLNIIRPQYEKYHYGRWAVYLKESGEFIGWCGLKYRVELDVTDLGYRFKKAFWGKGYASEAARRCIDYGFSTLHLPSLFGAAHVDNIASQKVLEKSGFAFIATKTIDGCLSKTYQLGNPAFAGDESDNAILL